MNLYFLVEGRRTEMKVYPKWLGHLVPNLTRVDSLQAIDQRNYYIFTGAGYPRLLDVTFPNAVQDYADNGRFDRFVVCLDVDDATVKDRAQAVTDRANIVGLPLDQLRVIPQDCCIETWFLGHRKAVSPNPNSTELGQYLDFYDVRNDDPEKMGFPHPFNNRSVFHSRFFQLVARDKQFKYTKSFPRHVVEKPYLDALIARRDEGNHLQTFGAFLELCDEIADSC